MSTNGLALIEAKGCESEMPTEVTVATGYPLGYTPPIPEVNNKSPFLISAERATLLISISA